VDFFPVIPAKAGIQRGAGGVAGGRKLDARDTLTLALSHKRREDLSLAIHAWFRVAGLATTFWIPAFAGMTGLESGI